MKNLIWLVNCSFLAASATSTFYLANQDRILHFCFMKKIHIFLVKEKWNLVEVISVTNSYRICARTLPQSKMKTRNAVTLCQVRVQRDPLGGGGEGGALWEGGEGPPGRVHNVHIWWNRRPWASSSHQGSNMQDASHASICTTRLETNFHHRSSSPLPALSSFDISPKFWKTRWQL